MWSLPLSPMALPKWTEAYNPDMFLPSYLPAMLTSRFMFDSHSHHKQVKQQQASAKKNPPQQLGCSPQGTQRAAAMKAFEAKGVVVADGGSAWSATKAKKEATHSDEVCGWVGEGGVGIDCDELYSC